MIETVFAKLADEDEAPEDSSGDASLKMVQTVETERVKTVIKGLGEALLGKLANKRIQILMERYPTCYDAEYKS